MVVLPPPPCRRWRGEQTACVRVEVCERDFGKGGAPARMGGLVRQDGKQLIGQVGEERRERWRWGIWVRAHFYRFLGSVRARFRWLIAGDLTGCLPGVISSKGVDAIRDGREGADKLERDLYSIDRAVTESPDNCSSPRCLDVSLSGNLDKR
jgi:hypothetical protein